MRTQHSPSSALHLAVAVLALLSPALAAGQTAVRLTADEVARRALASSHEIEAQRQELEAAVAGVDQAEAGYYPRLTAAARYTRLSEVDNPALGNLVLAPMSAAGPIDAGDPLVAAPLSFPSVLNQYALTAQLQVPLSDYLLRVPRATESAGANEKASALQLEAARLRIATEARKLFYAWMQSELQLTVAEQTLVQTNAHLADAKKLLDAGVISNADVLSAEAQVAQSELLLERAKNLAALNERRLRTLMHDDGPGRRRAPPTAASSSSRRSTAGSSSRSCTKRGARSRSRPASRASRSCPGSTAWPRSRTRTRTRATSRSARSSRRAGRSACS